MQLSVLTNYGAKKKKKFKLQQWQIKCYSIIGPHAVTYIIKLSICIHFYLSTVLNAIYTQQQKKEKKLAAEMSINSQSFIAKNSLYVENILPLINKDHSYCLHVSVHASLPHVVESCSWQEVLPTLENDTSYEKFLRRSDGSVNGKWLCTHGCGAVTPTFFTFSVFYLSVVWLWYNWYIYVNSSSTQNCFWIASLFFCCQID